jgi:hypothetical protein
MDLSGVDAWAHGWSVEVLDRPPLIAPARQFTYPFAIAGEEDAMARGALHLMVRPGVRQPVFLATCALGFRDPSVPTGVWACPNPEEMCALAGGYAYLIRPGEPGRCVLLDMKPVTGVMSVPGSDVLLFAGFQTILAWGVGGVRWTTGRLSWDGVRMERVVDGMLFGFGWDMMADREVGFEVDLATGVHVGGGYSSRGGVSS